MQPRSLQRLKGRVRGRGQAQVAARPPRSLERTVESAQTSNIKRSQARQVKHERPRVRRQRIFYHLRERRRPAVVELPGDFADPDLPKAAIIDVYQALCANLL